MRFLWRDSRTGVSSTTRVARRSASSSHPAMAAADLNPGLRTLSLAMVWNPSGGSFAKGSLEISGLGWDDYWLILGR
jgi:hypothetical protein